MSCNNTEVLFPDAYVTLEVDQYGGDRGDNVNLLLSFKDLQGLPFSVVNKQFI